MSRSRLLPIAAVLAVLVLVGVLLTREGERPEPGVLAARSGADEPVAAALRDGGARGEESAGGRSAVLVAAPPLPDRSREPVGETGSARGSETLESSPSTPASVAPAGALAGIKGRVTNGKGGFVALVGRRGAAGQFVATDSLLGRRSQPAEEVFAIAPIEDDGEFAMARPGALPKGLALVAIAPAGTARMELDERLARHEIELEWTSELVVRIDPDLAGAPIDIYWTPTARIDAHPLAEREQAVRTALKSESPYLAEIANAILWRATAPAHAEELTVHVPFTTTWPPSLATSRAGALVRSDRGDIALVPAASGDDAKKPPYPTCVIAFPPTADDVASVRGRIDITARTSRGHGFANRSANTSLGLVLFHPLPPGPSREVSTWTPRTPGGASLPPLALRYDQDGAWTLDDAHEGPGPRWRRDGEAFYLAMPFTKNHAEPRPELWRPIRSDVATPTSVFTILGEDGWRELGILPYSCVAPGGPASPGGSAALWTLGLRSQSVLIELPSGERSTWQRWSLAIDGPRGGDLIEDQGNARRYEFLPDLRIAPKATQAAVPVGANAPRAPRMPRPRDR